MPEFYGSEQYGTGRYGSSPVVATSTFVSGVRVTDDVSNKWDFPLVPTDKGGVGFTIEPRPWEPGDPLRRWRIPLHPFIGGLNVDRLGSSPATYAKANADATYPGQLLFPPKVYSLTMANGDTPIQAIEFNSKTFFIGGRYAYYLDATTNTLTEDKDFGVGKSAACAAVFNGELIVGMGETEKIYKRTTGAVWTQAGDATYAIALGVVGQYLWRAESTNKLSNCSTTPLTLANWTPASPNQYSVGDSTYAVNTIIDYGGIPWAGKGDGMYAPDPQSRFKHQTPQLRRTPHTDNCKGTFVAQGSLWVPSSSGLLQVKTGRSRKGGPEVTFRPDYRFWVRGGVEFGDYIYLLCTDEASSGNTFVCKMTPDTHGEGVGHDYIYQEWARLDGISKGYFIGVTTVGANPELVAGYGATGVRYINLGRGGGRDVDDPKYTYGTSLSLETGPMMPGSDLAELSTLVGVDTFLDYSRTNDSLTVAYRWDSKLGSESYTNLLDEAESGGGTAAITGVGWTKASRYAAANNTGRFLEVKFTGAAAMGGTANAAVTTDNTSLTDTRLALTSSSVIGATITCNGKTMVVTSNTATSLAGSAWSGGSNPGNGNAWSLDIGGAGTIRPSIREAWAHGYSHQEHTDVISLGLWAIDGAEVGGRQTGISRDECVRKWRDWQNRGVELLLEIEGYERGRNTRFLVKKVEVSNLLAYPGKHPGQTAMGDMCKVGLVRVDRASGYADA